MSGVHAERRRQMTRALVTALLGLVLFYLGVALSMSALTAVPERAGEDESIE